MGFFKKEIPTAERIVDVLISKKIILPEYREIAIKELEMELRRRTRSLAYQFAKLVG